MAEGELTMEVPVAWQDSVPTTCFSVVDTDADDVPPSPTLDPVSTPLVPGTFFQRGFLDCAQEALRFLTEEEGMSQNNPVVVGLRHHLERATPSLSPSNPHHYLSSSATQRGRFAPYTVPSQCSLAPGCSRRGVEKHSVLPERNSLLHRYASSTIPSTQKIEHVLDSDLISTDDLQGVLRCLGSGQSHHAQTPHQNSAVLHLSSPLSSPVLHKLPTGVEVCVRSEERNNSLDDSGISEVSSTELADEVDGEDTQCPVLESDCDCHVSDRHVNTPSSDNLVNSPSSADVVSVAVLPSAGQGLAREEVNEGGSDCRYGKDTTTDRLISENLPADNSLSSGSSEMSESVPDSVPSSSPTTASGGTVNSNPSSQLNLLSSLSSGSHRLTASLADSGDATASRIQSLASQILLLLQEEADAQDYSDDEEEADSPTSELGDSDVEEDPQDLEAEP
ncbi:uncharacterized protein LOC143283398 isoform X2 [Babylonia areolata]|uniref:uncharacterized protein LOC143283398 isoform X2 n=1 Tax=Babylonia areolata TaxID=304850 RepID=UPI003FCFB599